MFDQSKGAPTRSVLHDIYVNQPNAPASDRQRAPASEDTHNYTNTSLTAAATVTDAPNVCISDILPRRHALTSVSPPAYQVDAVVPAGLAALAGPVAALTLGGAPEALVAPLVHVEVDVALVLALLAAAVVHALVAHVDVEPAEGRGVRHEWATSASRRGIVQNPVA